MALGIYGLANEDVYQTSLVDLLLQFCALWYLVGHLRIDIAHVGDNHKEEQYRKDEVGH